MKIAAIIAGVLLGLLFILSASVVLFKLAPMPAPPAGTPAASFFDAMSPTGYLTFVKVIELLGGLCIAIPKTRNLGLLLLVPVIVNIFAFHALVAKSGVYSPLLLGIAAVTIFLLWVERKAWLDLISPTKS